VSVSANKALVRLAIESIWTRGDLEVADDLFDADYVNHYGLIADFILVPQVVKIGSALCIARPFLAFTSASTS
jgi:hypothetical protein